MARNRATAWARAAATAGPLVRALIIAAGIALAGHYLAERGDPGCAEMAGE